MADGDSTGTATLALMDRLWQIYGDGQPDPAAPSILYGEGVDRLTELGGVRRER